MSGSSGGDRVGAALRRTGRLRSPRHPACPGAAPSVQIALAGTGTWAAPRDGSAVRVEAAPVRIDAAHVEAGQAFEDVFAVTSAISPERRAPRRVEPAASPRQSMTGPGRARPAGRSRRRCRTRRRPATPCRPRAAPVHASDATSTLGRDSSPDVAGFPVSVDTKFSRRRRVADPGRHALEIAHDRIRHGRSRSIPHGSQAPVRWQRRRRAAARGRQREAVLERHQARNRRRDALADVATEDDVGLDAPRSPELAQRPFEGKERGLAELHPIEPQRGRPFRRIGIQRVHQGPGQQRVEDLGTALQRPPEDRRGLVTAGGPSRRTANRCR